MSSVNGGEEADHWIEISPKALRNNVRTLQSSAAGRDLLLVVKANAYGHGIAEVIPHLRDAAKIFGVSNLEEAHELRQLLPEARVLILSPVRSCDLARCIHEKYEVCISQCEEAERFVKEFPEGLTQALSVHAKLDIGMGRLGATLDEWPKLLQCLTQSSHFSVVGIMSHFPSADENTSATQAQHARFEDGCEIAKKMAPHAKDIHVNNSAATLLGIQGSDTLVRSGLALYGASPCSHISSQLTPVLSWKTHIALIRDMPAGSTISYGMTYCCEQAQRVAILPVGYAHGYPRSASGKAQVLLHGRRCSVLGRVTMNSMMVDVTSLPDVGVGDEVILLGSSGKEEISAWELAHWAATIPWEIFTNMRENTKRVVCHE